jgi:hypothetical protein
MALLGAKPGLHKSPIRIPNRANWQLQILSDNFNEGLRREGHIETDSNATTAFEPPRFHLQSLHLKEGFYPQLRLE